MSILITDAEHETNQTITWLPTEFRSAMNAGRLEMLLDQHDADDEAEENYPQYASMFAEVEKRIRELHAEIDAREMYAPQNWYHADFNDDRIAALQAELAPLIAARTAQRFWDADRKSAKFQKAFDENYAAWDRMRFPEPEADAEAQRHREWMMGSAG